MKDGRVLQIGTPAELFERPEHTFVGYFIGSPGHEPAADAAVAGAPAPWWTAHVIELASAIGALPRRPTCSSASGRISRRSTPDGRSGAGAAGRGSRPAPAGPRAARTRTSWSPRCRPDALGRRRDARLRLDPRATSHVYVDSRRVRGARAHERQALEQPRLVLRRAGAGVRAVLVAHPDDDGGELLGPGHDGPEQLLLERRSAGSSICSIPRPISAAGSRARWCATCSSPSSCSLIEVPLGIAGRALHPAPRLGGRAPRWS